MLHCGANLLPDIFKMLLRFRQDEIAIVSDIEKAFLQYKIHPSHRTFLRFFWAPGVSENPNAPIKEFWSTVLDFEIVSSPFIHCAGIKFHIRHLLNKYPENAQLLEDIDKHFYMDDLVVSSNTPSEGWQKFNFMINAFESGGFKLKKWATNNAELGLRIRNHFEGLDAQVCFDSPDFKFLGIGWNQQTDKLEIPTATALRTMSSNTPSKRKLLQATAQIFDPLGFISPVQ